jgi:mRNA-degrading endonuclease RelE of RelBE toxin-antitoxin system
MAYAVYTTARFEKEITKLSDFDKKIIEDIYKQLAVNSYVGDQLRYKFFREKRIREKRIYYLVYDDLSSVLIVALSGKKEQEETIDKIIQNLPEFKIYLENLLKQEN